MTGDDVLRLRERLGLTQAQLAELIGVSPNTVARWERDEIGMKPTTDRLIRLLTDPKKKRASKKRGK